MGLYSWGFQHISWLGPTWSLGIEEQFYIFLPSILFFLPAKRVPWLVGGMVGSAIALRLGIYYFVPYDSSMNYHLFPCRWDSLWIGVLASNPTPFPNRATASMANETDSPVIKLNDPARMPDSTTSRTRLTRSPR